MATTPDIEVSKALLTILRGLRISDDPLVGAAAAKREAEERDRLEKLKTGARRKQRPSRSLKMAA